MVISVLPLPLTKFPVTSIVSIVLLSEVFLIVILPVSASTASSNVKTILASTATSVALSDGEEDDNEGLLLSTVLKFKVVLLEIPSNPLKAELSIKT